MSEQTPEPPPQEPAAPYQPLDLETPQMDWFEKGKDMSGMETRELPYNE